MKKKAVPFVIFIFLILLLSTSCIKLNSPPVFSDIPDQSVKEGDILELNLLEYALDPDGDELTFKLLCSVGKIISNTYRFNPDYEASGTYNVEIEVSDGWGGNATDTFVITVMDVNRAPLSPSDPSPANGEVDVSLNSALSWSCSDPDGDPLSYDVYFGIDPIPATLVATGIALSEYTPDTLDIHTTYYWKIVAKDNRGGETEGPVWSFTTLNNSPTTPTYLSPINAVTGLEIPVTLSWECSDTDGDSLSYDIYLGISTTPPLLVSGITDMFFTTDNIIGHTTYYWKIVAKDGFGGESEGPTWSFSTANKIGRAHV